MDKVQVTQSTIIRGVHLDGDLLAKLNECKLLTKWQFNQINARILGNNIHDAGTFFVNSVLMQWPPHVFKKKGHLLIKALQSHDDTGNKTLARKLHESFSECEPSFACVGEAASTSDIS